MISGQGSGIRGQGSGVKCGVWSVEFLETFAAQKPEL